MHLRTFFLLTIPLLALTSPIQISITISDDQSATSTNETSLDPPGSPNLNPSFFLIAVPDPPPAGGPSKSLGFDNPNEGAYLKLGQRTLFKLRDGLITKAEGDPLCLGPARSKAFPNWVSATYAEGPCFHFGALRSQPSYAEINVGEGQGVFKFPDRFEDNTPVTLEGEFPRLYLLAQLIGS